MIYPARGRKQLVVLSSIAGVVALGIAAFLIVAGLIAGHPILALVLAAVLLPSYYFLFFAKTQRDVTQHWQYEIRGTDLLVNLPRVRQTVPLSSIERVVRATGSTRVLWGDVLQVSYVPGTRICPMILNPEDPEALLRGLSQADPGLTYRGDEISRTG